MERSSIPSLVKTRGANGAIERNPLGSRAQSTTGMLGYWKGAGSETKEESEVERRTPHQVRVPFVDSSGIFKSYFKRQSS